MAQKRIQALDNRASQRTIAAALSTTTGTRRAKHTSWRPFIMSSSGRPVARLTVVWGRAMLEVGFTAARKMTGLPLVMPPLIPPAPLREVWPAMSVRGSLCCEPRMREAPKPSPKNHLGNGRFHRIEEGLAQTGGDPAADAFHHSADRITLGRHLGEEGIEGSIVPFIPCKGQASDLRQSGIDLYRGNDFLGHHPGSNEGKGHPPGEHSAPGGEAVRSVFYPAHPVRMAGTGDVGKLPISGRVSTIIAEEELEGRAGGQPVLHAPDDLRDVPLRAGGSPLAAWTAAVDVLSEVPGTQWDTLRYTVDLNRHERAVGFPCEGNPECVSESVAHIVSYYW